MIDLQTLAQSLAISTSQSQDTKTAAASTAAINKTKNEAVSDAVKENLGVTDMSGLTTDEELTTKLASYVKTTDIFINGYFYAKKNNSNGSYVLIWNKNDGGGSQYYNKDADCAAAQIYSKYRDSLGGHVKDDGVRININPDGAYYTKGVDMPATGGSVNNETAVKGNIEAPNQLISALTAHVSALKNNS